MSATNDHKIKTAKCQILDASFIPECAKIMAEAFVESPSYHYIFQDFKDKQQRIQCLEWLFQRNIQLILNKAPSTLRGVLTDGISNDNDTKHQRVVACFLWTSSEHQTHSLWELLRFGIWEMPFRFGWKAMQRLFQVIDTMDPDFAKVLLSNSKGHHEDDDNKTSPSFVMLERLVVRPECQGQGWGSKALRSMLDDFDDFRIGKGLPSKKVYLTTQEARNVQFYLRLGFEVIGETDYFVEDIDYRYHSWTMVRTK